MKTATPPRFAAVVTDPARGESFRLPYVHRGCAERMAANFRAAGCLAHVEEIAPPPAPARYDAVPASLSDAPAERFADAGQAHAWAQQQANAHAIHYDVWRVENARHRRFAHITPAR